MTPDGYPDEHELHVIQAWHLKQSYADLMDYVRHRWAYADWGWHEDPDAVNEILDKPVIRYTISTAGWSGNEDLIQALAENTLFWSVCWIQSRRGGHYIFEVPVQFAAALSGASNALSADTQIDTQNKKEDHEP